MSERFAVVTVNGYRTPGRGGTTQPPGLTAHVVDRLYNSHVVATYRSEQPAKGNGHNGTIGKDEALWRARAHAEHMNAVYG